MNDIYNRKDEEFTVIGEVPESLKLNDPLYKEGFQAGAASRDAEFARLRAINSKLCEKSNWYVIHTARLEEERDQLRAHINTLTEAVEFCSGTSYIDDAHRVADEALITKIPTS